MLNDNHGIAYVAQLLQYANKSIGVTTMQTDTWFIKNIERAHQTAAERGGEVDTLTLASRKGIGEAIESEIAKTDVENKLQAVVDLGEQTLGNGGILFGQLEIGKPLLEGYYRHLHKVGDTASGNLHISGFLLQSGAMTGGAVGLATITSKHNAILYLILVLAHHVEKLVDTYRGVRVGRIS